MKLKLCVYECGVGLNSFQYVAVCVAVVVFFWVRVWTVRMAEICLWFAECRLCDCP